MAEVEEEMNHDTATTRYVVEAAPSNTKTDVDKSEESAKTEDNKITLDANLSSDEHTGKATDAIETEFKSPPLFKAPTAAVTVKEIESTKKEENLNSDEHTDKATDAIETEFKSPVLFKAPTAAVTVKEIESTNKEENPVPTKKALNVEHKNLRAGVKPLPKVPTGSSEPKLPYIEPPWGGKCGDNYYFDVLKNGKIIDTMDITSKHFFVFGRLKNCDVPMEHPSLSRYHALVQYCCKPDGKRAVGWYLYDLGSTHGTWLNKRKVDSRIYVRLRVGYMIKFGGSSRLFILQGPSDDKEEQSELTITEMKDKYEKEKRLAAMKKAVAIDSKKQGDSKAQQDDGCSWGQDALDMIEPEIDPDAPNPFALDRPANEELYLDDPKKTLRGYFEREGLDMPEYDAQELGHGKHKCSVELPIDDSSGRPIIAEATVTGKKKESVIACALEACRILDRHGELRKATHASREKKTKNWAENDYYDSDDDEFLDRTGDIERKRQQRIARTGKQSQGPVTYDNIMKQLHDIEKEIEEIQAKLDKASADGKAIDQEEGGLDALDAFMESIKKGGMDMKTKMAHKRRIFDLKREQAKLEKLADVARPANVPAIKPKSSFSTMPMIGKRKLPHKIKPAVKASPQVNALALPSNKNIVEEDSDEETQAKLHSKAEKTLEHHSKAENYPKNVALRAPSSEPVKSDRLEPENITDQEHSEQTSSENKETLGSNVGNSTMASDLNSHNKNAILAEKHPIQNHPDAQSEMDNISRENDQISTGPLQTDSISSNVDNKCTERKLKGPTLPPAAILQNTEQQNTNESHKIDTEQTPPPAKKRRQRERKKQKPAVANAGGAYDSNDPDYAVWVPPTDQSGDGTTHLNAKFGY